MRRRQRETFTTIKTEGNLLPVDLLQRITEGDHDLKGLTPNSYHLTRNERLNEVINRAWKRCEGAWRAYQSDVETLAETDAGTTVTRERWLLPLFQELGYGRLLTSKAQVIDGKTYPISHVWHHTPIHLTSFRQDLDRRTPGVAGAARMSPHSLVQEFLNRSDGHLWGMVSNGMKLRLLRDNASLTRQAYVEFDLDGMMSGEVYSDFVLLYMLLHESRVEAERPEQCWLEQWTQEVQRRGTRALDQLRDGVEKAIAALGQGFLANPANITLRQELQSGGLTTQELYQQLLRLVYRMIFLLVAEDRDLLLVPEAPPSTRDLYLQNYSMSRIRRLAGRLRGTRHGDLWQGLKVTFLGLERGEPALGLNPLGGFLFSGEAISDLYGAEIRNDDLLNAVRHLSFARDKRVLRPVDYRNLGTEELGSVYESLLELHPEVNVNASTFELKVAAGSERKTTGSYYTPTSLINCLLDSALDPVIEGALKKPDAEKALLGLKVVDPASGSGHFLIAAAHRIGKHLAMVRTGEAEPPPEARREALRDVVSHCIYGVDVNPLAVELCKVALWIETLDPGRPLGFLDHHIKCGNSLIGSTPELLEKGIPNDAFKPVEGDDKKIAAAIRKKNKEERRGEQDLFAEVTKKPDWQQAVEDLQQWGYIPEKAYPQVCEKAAKYETLRDRPAYRHEKEVADLWTAAFFWPLTKETAATVPTEDIFRRFKEGDHELKEELRRVTVQLAAKHRFFHWHLEFPEVFTNNPNQTFPPLAGGTNHNNSSLSPPTFPPLVGGNEGGGPGGFDCVLGNPPWERIKLQEKEFFSQKDPEIATAPNAAARKRLILALPETDPGLWTEFLEAKRTSEAESHFMRASGGYPLSAVGDINTYQIFAGLARSLISEKGRLGIVIPSGIATDDSNKQFFSDLTEKRALLSLYDFENREKLFPDVDSRMKFCLLTLGGENVAPDGADFAFFLTNVDKLKDEGRRFSLSAEDIALLNPNTRTCPIFRSKRDAELTKKIYFSAPTFKRGGINTWPVRLGTQFHSSNDAHRFEELSFLLSAGWQNTDDGFLKRHNGVAYPLYEGKMFELFDHRAATVTLSEAATVRQRQARQTTKGEHCDPGFRVQPFFWVPENKLGSLNLWRWILCFKKVTSATNERTLIAVLLPRCTANDSIHVLFPSETPKAKDFACLLSAMASFAVDYVSRQKLGGNNFNFFVFEQLPFHGPANFTKICKWEDSKTLRQWIGTRVVELVYTAWDIQSFAMDCGYRGPPYTWDEERRHLIRCELDAAYFYLYGIERDDVDYIMETFPIVKRKDEQKYGEYRTKRIILECYDAMAEATKSGQPYKTILDPPPADPRVAHPPRNEDT